MSSRAGKGKKSKSRNKNANKSKAKFRKGDMKISDKLPMKRNKIRRNAPTQDTPEVAEAKRKAKEAELERKAEEEAKEKERIEQLSKLNQQAHDAIINDYIAKFVDGKILKEIENMQQVEELELEESQKPKPKHLLTSFLEILLSSEPNKANLHRLVCFIFYIFLILFILALNIYIFDRNLNRSISG